ncbi:MAG TPA: aminopeptidase, partial [Thermoproteales archaeon]|nr:aminopeptidase [Thermoproteales archaeon]
VYKYPIELFDAHSYPKGALVLWTLLNIIGEGKFRETLKRYLELKAEDNVDTDDLRKVMEEVYGRSLDWFFEQYVNNSGHPVLKVSHKWIREEKVLEIRIEQSQGKDSLEEYWLPLEIKVIGKDYKKTKKIWIDKKVTIITFSLPSKPKLVCVDPNFKTFKVLNLDVNPEELLSIVLNCKYLYPRVMALRQLSKKGSVRHIEKLLNILLNEEEFWGLRSEAARTIGGIGGEAGLEALLKSLEKVKHPKVRRTIVSTLGKFKDERVGRVLEKILTDESESYYVRASAALSIAKSKYSKAFEVLVKALEYSSHNDVIASSAIEGLGIIGTEEALKIIKRYLGKEVKLTLRTAAVKALGYFPVTREIIELLEEASKSRHPRVRGSVVLAAEKTLSPKLLPLLDKLKEDKSGRIARNARETAEKIRKHMEKGEEYRKLREEIEKLREMERRLAERVERIEKR